MNIGNTVMLDVGGRKVRTLRDILPEKPGLRALFIAKTPAPVSVEAGHYLQGTQGRMFWNRLREYGLLRTTTPFEDDSMLANGYGLTDIVKVPRAYGNEPSDDEYRIGLTRILELIEQHSPSAVVFVYKRVLDQVLRLGFGLGARSVYGFNSALEGRFGTRVFVFPLPGTPCTSVQGAEAMEQLARHLGRGDASRTT